MRHFLFLLCLFPLLVQAELSLTDADGKTVSLAAPAQRIVSLAPHITDMLQSLGASRQIIAVTDDHERRGLHTQSVSGYPLVGDAAAINYEKILSLRPDMVIAWGSGTPRAWINQLRQLGLPVHVMEAKSLADIGQQIETLGLISGHEELARQQHAAYTTRLRSLQTRFSNHSRLRYFYQVWMQPLYSLGQQHLLSQALALCGADNIVPAGPVMAPLINPEFVLAANPDVILFGKSESAAARGYWSRFPRLQAVQKQRLLAVDDRRLTRPGPDMLVAVSALCGQLSVWRREITSK